MATGERTSLKRVEDSILEDLECNICFEIRPLKILTCSYGHSFCAHCINNIEGKRRCPLCRQHVTLPKEGAQGLPDDVNKEDLNDLLLWVRDHMNVDCVLCGFEGNTVAHKLYKYCQNERIPLCDQCQRRFKRKSNRQTTTVFRSSTLRTVKTRSDGHSSTLGRIKSRLMRRITHQDFSGSLSPRMRRKRTTSASIVGDNPVSPEAIELRRPLVSQENAPRRSTSIERPRPAEPVTPSAPPETSQSSAFDRSRHGSAHSFCELIANLYSQWSTGSYERANGVVFLPRDHVIVSDWYGEKLYKYDVNTGAVVKSRSLRGNFSCLERDPGHGPWSLLHYPQMEKLLVAETGSKSLRVVSPDNLESQKKRLVLDGVQQPVGLACLRNGHIVITEANYGGRHHVRIHDVNGMCLRQWDCSGRSGSPLYMTVDHRDRIIVSEHSNSCVKIFDDTGRLVGRYGDSNILLKPSGVAVDHVGRILVIHETPRGHQVAVLSSDGSRKVDTLAQSDRSLMNLTDTHMWDLKNIAVHRSMVALVGKEGLHMCKFGSFH